MVECTQTVQLETEESQSKPVISEDSQTCWGLERATHYIQQQGDYYYY